MDASKFPPEYQDQIQEMLEIRSRINELRRGNDQEIFVTVEQYAERLFDQFGKAPDQWTRKARERSLKRELDTGRRVLKKAEKGLF